MANTKKELICNKTNKSVIVEIMEDFSIETDTHGINDPCYALFMFHDPEALQANTDVALQLLNWYEQICDDDSLDQESPGEKMIGKTFEVYCWKTTSDDEAEPAVAGRTYKAEIIDFHGFGTDGFYIEELEMFVDTVLFAINHFAIV